MSTTTFTQQRGPRWVEVVSLLIPLVIVGAAGMAISYATLIDVAKTNGLPLPELFPILVDVGTVACLITDAQFRRANIPGRRIAGVTFAALSALSVFANATHASQHADPARTQVWIACILAATPPAALLAITHLVMKLLPGVHSIPLQRPSAAAVSASASQTLLELPSPWPDTAAESNETLTNLSPASAALINLPVTTPTATNAVETVQRWVIEEIRAGRRPSGATVGRRLGQSAKTGQRLLQAIDTESLVPPE